MTKDEAKKEIGRIYLTESNNLRKYQAIIDQLDLRTEKDLLLIELGELDIKLYDGDYSDIEKCNSDSVKRINLIKQIQDLK